MRAVRLEITQLDNRRKETIYVDFTEVRDLTVAKTIRYLLARASEKFKEVGIRRVRD